MSTILIADDHSLLREMLCHRLEEEGDFKVVATTETGDAAIVAGKAHQPDIAVIDIEMPGMNPFEAAKQIKRLSARTRVIFLSAFAQDSYIQRALDVEASAYLTKSEEPGKVVRAIRAVANGFTCFSPEIRSRLVIDRNGARLGDRVYTRAQLLTDREREILGYLARGMAKKEVARVLSISVKTVDAHATHIMQKLDIHDRVGLAHFAMREGLIEP